MRRTGRCSASSRCRCLRTTREVFADYEVYLAERDGALDGVLILEPRADDLLIWSVAVAPRRRAAASAT